MWIELQGEVVAAKETCNQLQFTPRLGKICHHSLGGAALVFDGRGNGYDSSSAASGVNHLHRKALFGKKQPGKVHGCSPRLCVPAYHALVFALKGIPPLGDIGVQSNNT